MLFIAIMLAHIYIGTIGMQGAFEAMGKGEVDVNWARSTTVCGSRSRLRKGVFQAATLLRRNSIINTQVKLMAG